jgi:hypothetical protein
LTLQCVEHSKPAATGVVKFGKRNNLQGYEKYKVKKLWLHRIRVLTVLVTVAYLDQEVRWTWEEMLCLK